MQPIIRWCSRMRLSPAATFMALRLALALDYLAIAVCQLAGISERRTERLMNPSLNEGLPAFLASSRGLSRG